jgi:hypothetical protein
MTTVLCKSLIIGLVLLIGLVCAIEQCKEEQGGGVCPAGGTCCLRYDFRSGCIPSDLGSYNATCCSDLRTGCAVGYRCGPNGTCVAGAGLDDPLVQFLPRYVLGHTDKLRQVHGLPVTRDAKFHTTHPTVTLSPRLYTKKLPELSLWSTELVETQMTTQRFATRQLVYLAGSQDICNITGHDKGWCYSHGLETSCMDKLQGPNRLARSERYFLSLQTMGVLHIRLLVPGVGHDHSLIFNSDNGLRAMFGWVTEDSPSTLQSTRTV